MKVRKIEQNTEEWHEYRLGKSGGSGIKDLWISGLPLKSKIVEFLERENPLTPEDKKAKAEVLAGMLTPEELAQLKLESDPKRRYYEMIAEAVARPITPNDYVEQLNGKAFSMMERGRILEPEAKTTFEEVTGKKLDEESVVWEDDEDPNIYISPDGSITSADGKVREAVEVKCLSSWEVIKAYLTNKYPKEYKPQVIKYFSLNEELETLYFVMFTDVIPGLEIQIFEVKREEVADKITDLKIFEHAVMKLVERDIKRIRDLSF